MKFLFMEPFFGGSHKSFALGWQAHSRHDIELLTLPDTFWKWRMRGAALQFIGKKKNYETYDGIITSDMMNLADFMALARKPLPPCLVYFHENQLTYPLFPGKQRDESLGIMNITTALAARRIIFNSRFHRRDFLEGASDFLNRIPGGNITWCEGALAEKSGVLYPGCPFPGGEALPGTPWLNPPLIIWNHRWEFDKNPGPFFKALKILKLKKIPFQLALLGEGGTTVPAAFASARRFFQKEIVTWGYAASRKEYETWLDRGAIVVSTANQENFGISVVEAVRRGCVPLLPDRLAYPEIIPREFHGDLIYQGYKYLPGMLENIILNYSRFIPVRDVLIKKMEQYAWNRIIAAYDTELDLLASHY
ncbi:Glycosyl transferases group 1 [Desulfocicer vacuolatum DSM 3385]|uniref:tRNA-queuosine alpha-mannosyltransferase n=1 Tax=Desulfocicer vacuolatum DSM 3385 TaxID=1121400 RepID=A0A1W1YLK3_9BACT|nr:DUF3524 domain-containing protein [Desulfocicer vacuolatum]SMC36681.1 Glycosyl transferases group 1 [Desulfocicer vacuolatum DSM 3385]